MSYRQLKWLAVLLPLFFMVGVLYIRLNFVPNDRSLEGNLFAVLAVAVGATLFSIFFFGIIEHRDDELNQRNAQVEALHEAALALTTELDLQAVLQKMVDLSRELLHSKYGALGVMDPQTNLILQFFTSGISPEERARIGAPPKGHGLLGVISPGGQPLIVNDIRKDPRSIGFPPNHPPMQSLLGVPIKSKGELFGTLYVADKVDRQTLTETLINFDENDCQLLEKFATQAAIAIENAQLYRKTQELAVLQERERFGMALHDGIMQSVYATGLTLQEAMHMVESKPDESQKRISKSIENLGQVLRDLRNYIMGLRTGRFQGRDLASSLSQLITELRANTLMNVHVETPKRGVALGLNENQQDELMFIAQEALNNIRKHAQASRVDVALDREDHKVSLSIKDDGVGFDIEKAMATEGNGLRNMEERAEAMGGYFEVWSKKGKGTRIQITVPLANQPEKVVA